MAAAADVKKNWTKLYTEPKTQAVDSETFPFTKEEKQDFLCQLLLAIKNSPRTVPRGLGGRYEPWKWVWVTEYDGDQIGCASEAFWKFATTHVPPEVLGTCLAARSVLGSKKNGGVRPFAIGLVTRRLVCKATAKLLTNKVRNGTRPHQYAVRMIQGPELLHKIVSAHVDIHSDAMGSVDVKNAHDAIARGAQIEIEAQDKKLWWCAVSVQGGTRARVQT